MVKYIFFGYSDYTKAMFWDIITQNNVCYFEFQPKSVIHKIVKYIAITRKGIMHYLPIFIKNKIYTFFYNPKFINKEDCPIFIFFELSPMAANIDFIFHLNTKYPQMKSVFYFFNILPAESSWFISKMNGMKSLYDKVLSFDEIDAEKYGLIHYDLFMSNLIKENRKDKGSQKNDLLFLGQNKERINLLSEIYEFLTPKNILCKFKIYSDSSQKNILEEIISDINIDSYEGIDFFNQWQSYSDIIDETLSTQCILEIVKDPSHSGCTLRTMEAIVLKKKLLTNNRYIVDKAFFNKNQMSVFNSPEEIDVDFIKKEMNEEDFVDPELVSPKKLLQFIDSLLKTHS